MLAARGGLGKVLSGSFSFQVAGVLSLQPPRKISARGPKFLKNQETAFRYFKGTWREKLQLVRS